MKAAMRLLSLKVILLSVLALQVVGSVALAKKTADLGTRSLFYRSEAEIRASSPASCEGYDLRSKIENLEHMCGGSVDQWKAYSFALLDLADTRKEGFKSRLEKIEEVVLKNTVITEAYAHLYLKSWKSFPACGRSLLPWVGGASLGSMKSGQVMRSALSAKVGGIARFDQYTDGDYRKRFNKQFGKIAGKTALIEATLTLGEGNREIFKDLYWQLLAGVTCGPDRVVATITSHPGYQQDAKLLRSLKAWNLLSEAARTCDPETVIEANRGFVEVEQYLVGQPVMYEGLIRTFGGFMLAEIIEAAVPSSLGYFPGFVEHAREATPAYLINFADVDQRVRWMKDQLGVMEDAFQAKAPFMEPLYCSVATDSEQTRAYLRNYRTPAQNAAF